MVTITITGIITTIGITIIIAIKIVVKMQRMITIVVAVVFEVIIAAPTVAARREHHPTRRSQISLVKTKIPDMQTNATVTTLKRIFISHRKVYLMMVYYFSGALWTITHFTRPVAGLQLGKPSCMQKSTIVSKSWSKLKLRTND